MENLLAGSGTHMADDRDARVDFTICVVVDEQVFGWWLFPVRFQESSGTYGSRRQSTEELQTCV